MEKFTFKTRLWIQVALINFCIVALAGVALRYKINFALPAINHKYLLHGHSHFAFVGWVTLALMALMVHHLIKEKVITNYRKYHWLLIANCITAYGMLVSFIIEGYAVYSITFSTLSIFVSYSFIFFYWRDLNKAEDKAFTSKWLKASLIIWAISSLGAFTLAFLMANKIMVQDYYFSAIYFFLHFQYNGWFLFVCFGLLFSFLYRNDIPQVTALSKKLFWIMAIMVAPTYLLSIIWLKLPPVLFWIANISGILQLAVLIYFLRLFPVIKKFIPLHCTKVTRALWIMASIAFVIKIVLQMLSIIPFLSNFAFGFRPVVIGYLHLSFLGIISFFIIGYFDQVLNTVHRHISKVGVSLFVAGVLLQEIVLMAQGLEAMDVEPLPYANIILFYCALLMFIGLVMIVITTFKKVHNSGTVS